MGATVNTPPKVSILLPVYNGEQYLREAVDSILSQTFSDFELIAINDGSRDGSPDILESYRDTRIRLFHQENIGLALTLNRALELATGQYVARQDADDVSLPERLEKQVAYLDTHPECGLLGSWSTILEENRPTSRGHHHPEENGALQFLGLFDSFFVHSAVMARRSVVLQAGGYPTVAERNPPEDFDLWSRMARLSSLANLPEPLLQYREVAGSISRQKAELINRRVSAIAVENVRWLLGNDVDQIACRDLVAIVRSDRKSLSSSPQWKVVFHMIDAIADTLLKRFPGERHCIQREAKQICRRVSMMRAERRLGLLPLALRVRAFFR